MSKKINDYNEELKVKVSALREYLTNKANNVILGITYWREHRHHKCYKCKKYGHIAADCDNICPLCDNIHPKVICVQTYYKTLKKIAKILNGVSELNIRRKMEQILTLEIVNEQQLVDIKYRYDNLEPQKQIDFKINKTKKVYTDLAPSMTTFCQIKHVFKNLKPTINKRVFIERTTSFFDIFKNTIIPQEVNSTMTLKQGRHIEFLMQSKARINNNRYMIMKKKKSSRMFIDMPYVCRGKNTVILREKREITCQSALIRQRKLDHVKELAKHLRKQRNKARNELNKYNPSMFNKVKAEIERKWKEVAFIKKGAKKEKFKALLLKEKQQSIIDNKLGRIQNNYDKKMHGIYQWQERLRQKQEKLDLKFRQANYLYHEANRIAKMKRDDVDYAINNLKEDEEYLTKEEIHQRQMEIARKKDYANQMYKDQIDLDYMHNVMNHDSEEDEYDGELDRDPYGDDDDDNLAD